MGKQKWETRQNIENSPDAVGDHSFGWVMEEETMNWKLSEGDIWIARVPGMRRLWWTIF